MSPDAYERFNLPFAEVYKQYIPALQQYLVPLQLTARRGLPSDKVTSAKDLAAHL